MKEGFIPNEAEMARDWQNNRFNVDETPSIIVQPKPKPVQSIRSGVAFEERQRTGWTFARHGVDER